MVLQLVNGLKLKKNKTVFIQISPLSTLALHKFNIITRICFHSENKISNAEIGLMTYAHLCEQYLLWSLTNIIK